MNIPFRTISIRLTCFSFLVFIFCMSHLQLHAATITVNSTEDISGPSAQVCTLRAAIRAANSNSAIGGCTAGEIGPDTLIVPAGSYKLTLTGAFEVDSMTGDLNIKEPLNIIGAGKQLTIIDGNMSDRIFQVDTAAPTSISNITIQNGNAPIDNIGSNSDGGAIQSSGALTITDSVIEKNFSNSGAGGAIYIWNSNAYIANTLFSDNKSGYDGGAIMSSNNTVEITGCVFSNNISINRSGGAINIIYGDLRISNSSIISNSAIATGGGLAMISPGKLLMDSMIFERNSATDGAGVDASGTIDIRNSIFRSNIAANGGGLRLRGLPSNGLITSSIFEGNRATNEGGGIYFDDSSMVITDSQFIANSAFTGGAITARSKLYLVNSQIQDNQASYGGGIYSYSYVSIKNSSMISNIATNNGAGVYNSNAIMEIQGSTLLSNVVNIKEAPIFGKGSAIFNLGAITVSNSTIGYNTVINTDTGGAAIANSGTYMSGSMTVVNSTIAHNYPNAIFPSFSGAPAIITNTIVANNGSTSCGLAVIDGGNNLQFPGTSCSSTITSIDPQLGAISKLDGGGFVFTLLSTSPAINAANPVVCSSSPVNGVDQRGMLRNQCDIGAYESDGLSLIDYPNHVYLPIVQK